MGNDSLETIYFLSYCGKIKSSFKSKSSSKLKIDLRNETSAEDKFQNVKEKELQNFNKKGFIWIYLTNFYVCVATKFMWWYRADASQSYKCAAID